MKKIAMLIASACAAFGAAADVTWKASLGDGTYDLADASVWNENRAPVSTDSASFPAGMTGKTYTLTASSDITLKKFLMAMSSVGNNDVTLDLGVGRTMTLTCNDNTLNTPTARFDGSGSTLTFKSGTINAVGSGAERGRYFISNILPQGNGGPQRIFVDGSNTFMNFDAIKFSKPNGLFCVTNGARVKGAIVATQTGNLAYENVTIQVTGEGTVWELPYRSGRSSNSMKLYVDGYDYNVDYFGERVTLLQSDTSNKKDSFLVKIDNGGVMTNFSGYVGVNRGSSKVLVDAGKLYTVNAIVMGLEGTASNNVIEVTNGGELKGLYDSGSVQPTFMDSYLYLGYRGKSSEVSVHDGGKFEMDQVVLGAYSYSRGGRFRVHDGGTARIKKQFLISRGFRVWGWSARLASGQTQEVLPYIISSNNVVEVTGDGSKLEYGTRVILDGHNNRIHLEDGAVMSNFNANEGYMHITNCVALGNNTLFVGDRAKFIGRIINLYGCNSVCVSNGLVRTDMLIRSRKSGSDIGGMTFSFAGASPRMETPQLDLQSARLKFDLPLEGYAEGAVISASNEIIMDSACALDIDVTKCRNSGRFVLMQSVDKLTVPDAVLSDAESNANSNPEMKVVVKKSADGKQIVLSLFRKGMKIIVR